MKFPIRTLAVSFVVALAAPAVDAQMSSQNGATKLTALLVGNAALENVAVPLTKLISPLASM